MDIKDRARGAIVGMGVGEALGAPLEGLTRAEIEERAGNVTGFVNPRQTQPEYRAALFLPAAYEDETQTALAAVDVLALKHAFPVEFFQDRLGELGRPVDGLTFGCFRRARRNLRVAVRRIQSGIGWRESGVNTAGSSAASRGIPIGIFFRDDADARLKAAVESALVTHRDPRACGATAAVAELAALVARREEGAPSNEEAVEAVVDAARRGEDLAVAEYSDCLFADYEEHQHHFSEAVRNLKELVELDVEEALGRIKAFAADKAARPITSATKGFALTGVVSALYFFLTGQGTSFSETVLDTIVEGGSSDTLGCLVGGLCGSLFGIEGIPEEWRGRLRSARQLDERGAALVAEERVPLTPLVLVEVQVSRPAGRPQGRHERSGRGGPRGRDGRGYRHGGHQRGPRGAPHRGGYRGGGPRRGPGGPRRQGARPGGYREGGPPRGGQRSGPGRGGPPGRSGGYRSGGYRQGGGGRPGGPRPGGGRGGYRDGPRREGGYRDGPRREGGYRDGPRREGGYRDGPRREGGYRGGPRREGGYRDGPRREGGYRGGPRREGGYRDGPRREGGYRDGPRGGGDRPPRREDEERRRRDEPPPRAPRDRGESPSSDSPSDT